MTTPTGTISMTDIQTEFGGSSPISLNEYYAGGPYVPAGTAGIPSSGTISMNDLRGKSKAVPVVIEISPNTVPEGDWFYVTFTPGGSIYSPLYWSITGLVNLDSSDFSTSSGTIYYDYDQGDYPTVQFRAVLDTTYEGVGTFTVTAYSNSSRTNAVGTSSAVSLTDTYSAATPTLSRTSIYRYANLDNAYRASVASMSTTGLEGSTIYYEIYSDGGNTLTSSDLDNPSSLTGTLTVPAGGLVSVVVRATEWDGTQTVTVDKNVYVRFRLGSSTGAILGTSPAVLLYRMPVASFSFSPSTVREGGTSTLTGSIQYIPYGFASIYWNTSGTASPTADWYAGVAQGIIPWDTQVLTADFIFSLDNIIESNETLTLTFKLNSYSGTAFWAVTVTIVSPAIITSAYAGIGGAFIANAGSYPESRTFSVQFRNAGGGWNDSNVTSPSEVTIPVGSVSSNSIVLLNSASGNNGTHSMEYRFGHPSYEAYTVSMSESFTWPIYDLVLSATGSNTSGSTRNIYAQITSTPSYGSSRSFSIQYRIKTAGAASWGAWTNLSSLTIPVNYTYSSNTLIYGPAPGAALFDLQVRCVLSGQEIRESNILYNLWLG